MVKHTAVIMILVALLVGGLMYCISPDEATIACSIAKYWASSQFDGIVALALHRGTKGVAQLRAQPAVLHPARNIRPDPFGPFARQQTAAASRSSSWLKGPRAIAVWLSMVVVLLAARRFRKKRFKFAMEQKMAITLSKAVRQM
jgi:hypothetical protein